MKRIAMTLLGFGAVAGCGPSESQKTESDIQNAVPADMIDPNSAIFGELSFTASRNSACITVNGKNSFGGYTGNQQAIVRRDPQTGAWISTAVNSHMSHALCIEAIANDRELMIEGGAPAAINSSL